MPIDGYKGRRAGTRANRFRGSMWGLSRTSSLRKAGACPAREIHELTGETMTMQRFGGGVPRPQNLPCRACNQTLVSGREMIL